MARSLLISGQVSLREAAPRVQCHVRSSSKRVLSERAAKPARPDPSQRTTVSGRWSIPAFPRHRQRPRRLGGAAATRIAAPYRRCRRQTATTRRSRDTVRRSGRTKRLGRPRRQRPTGFRRQCRRQRRRAMLARHNASQSRTKVRRRERRHRENERQAVFRQDRRNRQAASAQQGAASVTTPNPVAVAIPVAIVSTDVPGRTASRPATPRHRWPLRRRRSPPATAQPQAGRPLAPAHGVGCCADLATASAQVKVDADSPDRDRSGSRHRERRRGGVGKDRSSSRGRRARRHGRQTPVTQTAATDAGIDRRRSPRRRRSCRKPRCSRPRSRRQRRPGLHRRRRRYQVPPNRIRPRRTHRPRRYRPMPRRRPSTAKPAAGNDRCRPRESRRLPPMPHRRRRRAPSMTMRRSPRPTADTPTDSAGCRDPGDRHDPAAAPDGRGHGRSRGPLSVTAATNAPVPLERARARDRRLGARAARAVSRSGSIRPTLAASTFASMSTATAR